jgi:hypothetical protein
LQSKLFQRSPTTPNWHQKSKSKLMWWANVGVRNHPRIDDSTCGYLNVIGANENLIWIRQCDLMADPLNGSAAFFRKTGQWSIRNGSSGNQG